MRQKDAKAVAFTSNCRRVSQLAAIVLISESPAGVYLATRVNLNLMTFTETA
jgi:hypothetical protein